jgi:hypothetical protein
MHNVSGTDSNTHFLPSLDTYFLFLYCKREDSGRMKRERQNVFGFGRSHFHGGAR